MILWEVNTIRRGQIKKLPTLILLTTILTVIVMAADGAMNDIFTSKSGVITKPALAAVINGKSIFDDAYVSSYLVKYNNLSDIEFKSLAQRERVASLKTGNVKNRIEGFILDNKGYAIHLIACDGEKGTCNFRINGLLVKDLSPSAESDFNLSENYSIRIKSIKFDYCDNRRICDYLLQSYDLVEIEVMKR